MREFQSKGNVKLTGSNTSSSLESLSEMIQNPYIIKTLCIGKCGNDAYRIREEDETVWISCREANPGTDMRPFFSSEQQNSNDYFVNETQMRQPDVAYLTTK